MGEGSPPSTSIPKGGETPRINPMRGKELREGVAGKRGEVTQTTKKKYVEGVQNIPEKKERQPLNRKLHRMGPHRAGKTRTGKEKGSRVFTSERLMGYNLKQLDNRPLNPGEDLLRWSKTTHAEGGERRPRKMPASLPKNTSSV